MPETSISSKTVASYRLKLNLHAHAFRAKQFHHVSALRGSIFLSCKVEFRNRRVRVIKQYLGKYTVHYGCYGRSVGTTWEHLFYQEFRINRVCYNETPLYMVHIYLPIRGSVRG